MLEFTETEDGYYNREVVRKKSKKMTMTSMQSTDLLLRCVDQTDELLEPLETLMLLVDDLRADVNAVNKDTGNTPLHR